MTFGSFEIVPSWDKPDNSIIIIVVILRTVFLIWPPYIVILPTLICRGNSLKSCGYKHTLIHTRTHTHTHTQHTHTHAHTHTHTHTHTHSCLHRQPLKFRVNASKPNRIFHVPALSTAKRWLHTVGRRFASTRDSL